MSQAEITRARAARTRRANLVLRSIRWMLHEPAKWNTRGELVPPGWVGLPSWWPFWSDSLKDSTRQLVREARKVAALEGREL